MDFSHTKIDKKGLDLLLKASQDQQVANQIQQMFNGDQINSTEKRSVLHVLLRTQEAETDQQKEVVAVRDQISAFSEKIRSGTNSGFSGKKLTQVVAIGIGGSYLGPEFVYEALRYDSEAQKAAEGRQIKFLANVDPTDVSRAMQDIDIESTLFVIVSKTFTTAETMLNARTIRSKIIDYYTTQKQAVESEHAQILSKHLCAVSTNLEATTQFGIASENVFGFWNWVGGRYSVSSAVGVLPLALHYGFPIVDHFLKGLNSVDTHLVSQIGDNQKTSSNGPLMLGLIGFYNTYVAGIESRAILPYSQALLRFPAHIQQLDMESNGKGVSKEGVRLESGIETGPIILGEPGTNGQHSFYQLMHQGRKMQAEFIGFTRSQTPIHLPNEPVSNHDELMSNFFAQPDALAHGKTIDELKEQGVPEELQAHKLFTGDRPSLSILFEGALDAQTCGQLLALYEHRVAVEGFLYGINSFDQWGVELGKVLAKDVRSVFTQQANNSGDKPDLSKFNPATQHLLTAYLASK